MVFCYRGQFLRLCRIQSGNFSRSPFQRRDVALKLAHYWSEASPIGAGVKVSNTERKVCNSALKKSPSRKNAAQPLQPQSNGAAPNLAQKMYLLRGLSKPHSREKLFSIVEKLETGNLTKSDVNTIISALGKAREPQAAFQFFRRVQAQAIELDSRSFNVVIAACGKNKQVGKAENLLHEMIKSGPKPNVVTFNTCIGAFLSLHKFKQALGLLDLMQQQGLEPDVYSYTFILGGLGRAGKHEEAMALLQEMKSKGISPNVVSYNSVIAAFAKVGDWKNALDQLREMERAGVLPDLYSYNAVIKALGGGRKNEWQMATQLLRTVELRGIQPDLVSYTTVANILGRAGEWEEAVEVIRKMRQSKIVPDLFAGSTSIGICCSPDADAWQEALYLLQWLENSGLVPKQQSLNECVAVCLRNQKWDQAFGVIREISRREMQVTQGNLVAAVQAHLKLGSRTEATNLFWTVGLRREAVKSGACVKVVNAILSACVEAADGKEAVRFLVDLEREGFPLNAESASILLKLAHLLCDEADDSETAKVLRNTAMSLNWARAKTVQPVHVVSGSEPQPH